MSHCSSGETNFILVNRDKLLDTAFDELKFHSNYRVTLEVQFYDEVSFMCSFPEVMKGVHNLELNHSNQTEEKQTETKFGVLQGAIRITAPSA